MVRLRLDGYLPRCDVASFVADRALTGVGVYRARLWVRGARWDAGRFTCSYRYRSGDGGVTVSVSCLHRGRRPIAVWLRTRV